MANQWYIRKNSQISGSYTSTQIRTDALSGLIHPEDEISKLLDGPWSFARKAKGLFSPQQISASAVPPVIANPYPPPNSTLITDSTMNVGITKHTKGYRKILSFIFNANTISANSPVWYKIVQWVLITLLFGPLGVLILLTGSKSNSTPVYLQISYGIVIGLVWGGFVGYVIGSYCFAPGGYFHKVHEVGNLLCIILGLIMGPTLMIKLVKASIQPRQ